MPPLSAIPSSRRLPPTLCFLFHHRATFINARVKWVRDRGLDLAVSKEKHLHPFLALKNLLLSHRHGSLPLSSVAEKRHHLRLPFRALRFVRKYPSAFLETSIHGLPIIRPTPELTLLHQEEMETFDSCKQDCAHRLIRLLMLTRRRRLPLALVDRLGLDLGLPYDYVRTLFPDYLDYFEIVSDGGNGLDLELVCWNKDLAVSALEKAALGQLGKCRKGSPPLEFPLQFPRGFDLDKRVKKWTEDFQKLPYVSPYEDGTVLDPLSTVAEKWTVGVLHELLSLFVSKKTEKENLVELGKHVGLPVGFKKAITRYPGIFYLSNKLRTQTVVLRELYKRDRLVDKHPLMGMRYRYIFLMSKGAEGPAAACADEKDNRGAEEDEEGDEMEDDESTGTSSESEYEEESDDDQYYENENGSTMG